MEEFHYTLFGLCIFTGVMILFFPVEQKPTAMDVYQGKTTLEYTIVNGVKVDSCVVWKDKKIEL